MSGRNRERVRERREETRRAVLPSRAWLRAASAPRSRSKLEAGSQKLPVPVESAWSWIILPKGIFIGRECMQKRGHHHKGAAPADLALTQLREWTHDFVSAVFEQTPRNGLPNFPSYCFGHSYLPSFLSSFFSSFLSSFLDSFLPCLLPSFLPLFLPSFFPFLSFFFPYLFLCISPQNSLYANPLY